MKADLKHTHIPDSAPQGCIRERRFPLALLIKPYS